MKRILISVIALFMICSLQSSAQVAKFGVTAGMNFGTSKFTEIDVEAKAGWNAGVTCMLDLPLGFSVQPSLIYSQKNSNITRSITQNMGYLEVPVSVQWGPDLLVFRPFVDITPYVGYAISNKTKITSEIMNVVTDFKSWEGKQRFEYGLGLGGGINVWKLQILARYCWNFGSLYDMAETDGLKEYLDKMDMDGENFGGVTLSVSFFF